MNNENILSKISKMPEEEVIDLACNTSDVEILKILAENENYEVRHVVAGNKNAPIEALEALSIDNNKLVSETAEEALKECKEKNKASMKI